MHAVQRTEIRDSMLTCARNLGETVVTRIRAIDYWGRYAGRADPDDNILRLCGIDLSIQSKEPKSDYIVPKEERSAF